MKKFFSSLMIFFLILPFVGKGVAEAATETEPNDDLSQATPLTFVKTSATQFTTSIDGKISYDDDYYRFHLDKRGKIVVKLTENPSTKFYITLLDKNGDYIDTYTTKYNSSKSLTTIFSEGLTAGDYYIEVSYYDGSYDNVPYTLAVDYTQNDYYETEDNDSLSQANYIQLNTTYNGWVDFLDDDYYSFKLSKKGEVKIDINRASNTSYEVELLNSSGDIMEDWDTDYTSNTGLKNIIHTGLPAGTYFVRITTYDDKYNIPYQFKVSYTANDYFEVEPNDFISEANAFTLNKVYTGVLSDYFDYDCYRLTLTKKMSLSLYLTRYENVSLEVNLFNQSESIYNYYDSKYGKNGLVKLFDVTLNKGTYFIRVSGNDSDINKIKYNLKVIERDTTPPAAPKVNKVSNKDTYVTGTTEAKAKVTVKAGTKVLGSATADSKGYFKIKISKQKAGTTLLIYAEDSSHNRSSYTKTTVLDRTPPGIPTVKTVTYKSTTVSGKAEAGSIVYVYNGSKYLGKGTANSKGNYVVHISKQKKGSTLKIYAKDKAGNKSGYRYVKVK